jgi:hypothetical protein
LLCIPNIHEDKMKIRIGAEMKKTPLAANRAIDNCCPMTGSQHILTGNGTEVSGRSPYQDMCAHGSSFSVLKKL